jgi:hypothetical protein
MRHNRWLTALALSSLALACQGDPSDRSRMREASESPPLARDSPPPPSFPALPPDSLRDVVVEQGLRLPRAERAELIALLGPPDSMRAHAEPNRHSPERTDTIAQLFYPGLRLEYRVVGQGPTVDLLNLVELEDNRFLAFPELGVGAGRMTILGTLGEPRARTDSTVSYDCGSCLGAENPVVYSFDRDDRVSRVTYTYYVD